MTTTERLRAVDGEVWWIIGLSAAFVALMVLLAFAIQSASNDCESRGGTLVSDTSTVVGGNGQVGTSTTYTCYSEDGRRLG